MYGNITYAQQIASQVGHGDSNSTGAARRAAAGQFWAARLTADWRLLWRRVTGRNHRLADLNTVAQEQQITRRRFAGICSVPLKEIVGSEGRCRDFDAAFQPIAGHIRDRWVGIASARMRGVVLPPVSLVKFGGRYYVRDGNHRVSVALSLGQSEIDAEVTVWESD